MRQIIIAHYKENLGWTSELTEPYVVYSRTLPSSGSIINIPHNIGRESYVYTKYIADNYENLPDRCVFVHGHEISGHQLDTTPNLISRIDWSKEYCSINYQIAQFSLAITNTVRIITENGYTRRNDLMRKYWMDVFSPYTELPSPPILRSTASAQFMVSRERILWYPKEFYVRSYEWLFTTTMDKEMWNGDPRFKYEPSHLSARLFEWTWEFLYSDKNKRAAPKSRPENHK